MHKRDDIRDLILLCQWIEDNGNKGWYYSSLPYHLRYWVTGSSYRNDRRDILIYQTGFGWRVRKNPHWRTVIRERFKR